MGIFNQYIPNVIKSKLKIYSDRYFLKFLRFFFHGFLILRNMNNKNQTKMNMINGIMTNRNLMTKGIRFSTCCDFPRSAETNLRSISQKICFKSFILSKWSCRLSNYNYIASLFILKFLTKFFI
jgi:hypothetical protein